MRRPHLERFFPVLKQSHYSVESEPTDRYNCIAWAAGDTGRWWWPGEEDAYWPVEPEAASMDLFRRAFSSLGYEPCSDSSLESGFEKVAIYTGPTGVPTHMARQLESGEWTSKCGRAEDIIHALEGLEGQTFQGVVQILRRPTSGG